MADSEPKECPCSNITIMQLFHELKQRYPKIPDHVVSKVIKENSHDKTACETILERESHYYLQSYPGALISGNVRDQSEPLCTQCNVPKVSQPQRSKSGEPGSSSWSAAASKKHTRESSAFRLKNGKDISAPRSEKFNCDADCSDDVSACPDNCGSRLSHSECSKNKYVPSLSVTDYGDCGLGHLGQQPGCESRREATRTKKKESVKMGASYKDSKFDSGNTERNSSNVLNSSSSSLGTYLESFTEEEEEHKDRIDASSESSAVITDRTSESGCDSETKEEDLLRSQTYVESSSRKGHREREIETCTWSVDGGRKSAIISGIISHSSSESPPTHNYQVAVECSMHHVPLDSRINRDNTRSFTSVNLSLRPPSSEPQPPIEIQSGQSLTYTTSSFDPKKGYQSQLQIRIDPELIEKQKERKDLLARELQREKDKLRCMQNEVRLMKAAIAQRPDPHILPKLKADILRLRTECERLTAAVDMYSDNQSNLPLGETNEEFYRNIYTGQRFQREGSWSCQLCTFRNHPLLSVCEECEMPRLPLGTAVKDVRSRLSNVFSNNNNTSFCTGAGTSTSASLITAPLQER